MLLYHGSAQFDAIMKEGLLPTVDVSNDFSEDFRLTSLGGVYLTSSPSVAAFYADIAVHSEQSFGMDPCLFMIEVDHHSLIADEDKVWLAIQELVQNHLSVDAYEEGLDDDEVKRLFDESIGLFGDLVSRVERLLHVDFNKDENEIVVGHAIKAFALRSLSCEWDPHGAHSSEVEAINMLCTRCRATLEDGWLSKHFNDASLTARTLEPIGTITAIDGPRIVGYACLNLSKDGLTVTGVDYGGDITLDQVIEFQADFIERNLERGAIVVPFDLPASLSP
jgi:hypothetical protein